MPPRPHLVLALATAPLLLAAAATAQTPAPAAPPTARLQQLLAELRATDAAAWTARLQQLEQQAKAQEADAAKLVAEAKVLQQRADAALAAAKSLRAEGQQLQELQRLLLAMPAPTPAPDAKPAAPPATPGKAPPPEAPAAGAAAAPGSAPTAPAAATPPAAAVMRDPATPAPDAPAAKPAAAPAPATARPPEAAASAKDDAAAPVVSWAEVEPIFRATCVGCHEPGEQKGGLDLSTFRGALAGGGSGQSIVPGEPAQSRLWRMVAQEERPFMPRNADPLTASELATVRRWIEHGAAETPAAARAFVAERGKQAKMVTTAAAEPAAPPANAATLPADVPPLAVRRAPRAPAIASIARSPAAPLLAMPGIQQVLLLHGDGRLAAVLPTTQPHLGPLAFGEDGTTLLAAGGERGRRGVGVVYEVRTGTVLATVGDERDVPLAAALHHKTGLVALGGAGKHTRVHRLRDGSLAMAGRHADFVLALAFAPDGAWLAAADRAGTVQVFEPATGRVFQTLLGHQGAVHALAFDRTGKSLLTAGADGTLRLWDVAAAKERWRQNAHPNQQALACAFGPGDVLASAGSDGVLATFTAAGKPGARSPAVGEWLYAVAFGADGAHLLAGDWRGRLHHFDVAAKKISHDVPLAVAQN